MPISISPESPLSADSLRLLAELDAYLHGLYPSGGNPCAAPEDLAGSDAMFLVARVGGAAVGCGAVKGRLGYAEILRLFVRGEFRWLGIGRMIMEDLEIEASRRGFSVIRLETGIRQGRAVDLYRLLGYWQRGPFGEYVADPLSIFMEKRSGRSGNADS